MEFRQQPTLQELIEQGKAPQEAERIAREFAQDGNVEEAQYFLRFSELDIATRLTIVAGALTEFTNHKLNYGRSLIDAANLSGADEPLVFANQVLEQAARSQCMATVALQCVCLLEADPSNPLPLEIATTHGLL